MDYPVRFFPYTQITEIGLLIELLEENGIAAFPEEMAGPGLDPFMAQSIQGKWLRVNANDLERARAVLLELKPELASTFSKSNENSGLESVKGWCPVCESENVGTTMLPGWKSILANIFPFISPKRKRKCATCGFQWTD